MRYISNLRSLAILGVTLTPESVVAFEKLEEEINNKPIDEAISTVHKKLLDLPYCDGCVVIPVVLRPRISHTMLLIQKVTGTG
jgi:hypothetical protein